MFKALINWYSRKVASYLPTSLQTMQETLKEAEAAMLRNTYAQEEAACQAEIAAVITKHTSARCQRLQRFIKSEKRALGEASAEDMQMGMRMDEALEALLSAVANALKEMEKRSADKKVSDKEEPESMNERELEAYRASKKL